jgi:hypothetical protein
MPADAGQTRQRGTGSITRETRGPLRDRDGVHGDTRVQLDPRRKHQIREDSAHCPRLDPVDCARARYAAKYPVQQLHDMGSHSGSGQDLSQERTYEPSDVVRQ